MENPWIAALVSLFIWWFATGAILLAVKCADRRGGGAHRRTALAGLPLLGAGIWGFVATSGDPSVAGVYLAFFSALAIWGWIELAFLAGVVTGPNGYPCPPGVTGWERFIRAWGTIAYHEMALTAALVAMMLWAWDAPNAFGLWTFLVLFLARISAKLNLYLGVPRINTEFLPHPLLHLASHFRRASMNGLFPLSVTLLTLATGWWLTQIMAGTADAAQLVGYALLAVMTALALIEHWLMVVPLPDAKLWRWMLPSEKPGVQNPGKTDNGQVKVRT
ncbi:MAG: DUF3623 domain-containing protein [Rhodobacteraceae bacterium]|nr:DUF3623 domain-containing protein [Paracoccaceae bacterium]